jgi:hypothetical protein
MIQKLPRRQKYFRVNNTFRGKTNPFDIIHQGQIRHGGEKRARTDLSFHKQDKVYTLILPSSLSPSQTSPLSLWSVLGYGKTQPLRWFL